METGGDQEQLPDLIFMHDTPEAGARNQRRC